MRISAVPPTSSEPFWPKAWKRRSRKICAWPFSSPVSWAPEQVTKSARRASLDCAVGPLIGAADDIATAVTTKGAAAAAGGDGPVAAGPRRCGTGGTHGLASRRAAADHDPGLAAVRQFPAHPIRGLLG